MPRIVFHRESAEGYRREPPTCQLNPLHVVLDTHHVVPCLGEKPTKVAVACPQVEHALAGVQVMNLHALALSLRPPVTAGDVVRVPTGRRSGLAIVLDPGTATNGESHPLVLTEDRWAGRLAATDFPSAVTAVQSSSNAILCCHVPMVIIGSIVNVMPGRMIMLARAS